MKITNYKQSFEMREDTNLDHMPHIRGYDFNEKFNFSEFIKSYSTMGFQGSNLAKAIEVIKVMKREKVTIFLAFTSNMITSGNRELIRYLVEHKIVQAIITTAGGIEEDIIKSLKPFVLGSFGADGKYLFEKGVNRTGNIFVTNDRYTAFEKFMNEFLAKQKTDCASDLLREAGKEINKKDSVLYWAWKNKIPVFCPALTDGAFGDLLYFQKQRQKDFKIDIVEDLKRIVDLGLNAKKTGIIVLGGGTAKHYALNAQIFREGADYAVYINTGSDFDGSDSGASIDEAVTWGKIKGNALQVKVHGDATIAFPLIMAGVLQF